MPGIKIFLLREDEQNLLCSRSSPQQFDTGLKMLKAASNFAIFNVSFLFWTFNKNTIQLPPPNKKEPKCDIANLGCLI